MLEVTWGLCKGNQSINNTGYSPTMNSFRLFLTRMVLSLIPETRGFGLKRMLYRWAGVIIGDGVKINSSVRISGIGKLTIGNNTWIGPEVMIACSSEISIGADCDIAPRVFIGDGTHIITPGMDHIAGRDVTVPVHVGNGCWLCVNCTVLPGVSIGDKCVVAAGAVVNKDCDQNRLVAGVPAKVIKELD